jgi:hypothetical protein
MVTVQGCFQSTSACLALGRNCCILLYKCTFLFENVGRKQYCNFLCSLIEFFIPIVELVDHNFNSRF